MYSDRRTSRLRKSTIGEKSSLASWVICTSIRAMYRAVTWLALHEGVDINDGKALGELARRADIVISHPHVADGRQYTVTGAWR